VFDSNQGVPSASLAGTGISATVTDESGRFVVEACPSVYLLDVAQPGFVTRRLSLLVPGGTISLSLIPTDFDLVSFGQLSGSSSPEGISRWTQSPGLVVQTSILECTATVASCVATSAQASAGELDALQNSLHAAIDQLSLGRWRFVSTITETAAPGATVQLRNSASTIRVALVENLSAVNPGVAGYGGFNNYGEIRGGSIWLSRGSFNIVSGRTRLVGHEVGHALGYGHVTTGVPSIMSAECSGVCRSNVVSPFDTQGITILHDRRPGTLAPDVDGPGFYLKAPSSSVPRVLP
jgi:hypothetical protein